MSQPKNYIQGYFTPMDKVIVKYGLTKPTFLLCLSKSKQQNNFTLTFIYALYYVVLMCPNKVGYNFDCPR